jgi:hypothetical protein
MKDKFWQYMDSCKGFWMLIIGTLIAGIAYMTGASKLIDWYIGKKEK